MTRIVAASLFLLASLTAPAMAETDIGFDCAEGSDEDIVAPQQTPFPAPGS